MMGVIKSNLFIAVLDTCCLFSALLNAAAGISCLLSSVCSLSAPSSPRDSLLTVHSAPIYLKVGQHVSASPRSSLMRSSLIYSKQQGMFLICIRIHTVHYSTTQFRHIQLQSCQLQSHCGKTAECIQLVEQSDSLNSSTKARWEF